MFRSVALQVGPIKVNLAPSFQQAILPLASHWDWQSSGNCANLPSEIFFHPEAERGEFRRGREKRAKAICKSCPVLSICREFALVGKETYGIWGGLSSEERLDILNSTSQK